MQNHKIETNSELIFEDGGIYFYQNYRQRYTVIPITTVRGPSSISIPLTTSTATSSLIRFLCIYTHVLSYDTYTHVDK